MAELVMVKRAGRAGEIGLFPAAEVFEEEFSLIKNGVEAEVSAKVRGTERYIKFSHVIAQHVLDCTELFSDKETARDHLLIDCRHVKRKFDHLRDKSELVPLPTRDLDATAWLRLIRLMVHFAITQYNVPAEALDSEHRRLQNLKPPEREEPPPHEEIPEGPTTPPERPTEPAGEPPAEPSKEPEPVENEPSRAPPEVSDPEPPVSDQAEEVSDPPPPPTGKKRTKPTAPEPDIGPEPPWPTDIPTYTQFAIWHCEKARDEAGFIVWWNSDEQWKLRQSIGIGVVTRKDIEARFADKFSMFAAKKP